MYCVPRIIAVNDTLLEHMIASHHGNQEYGAITEPAIPEAAVLHALDMIDSRIDIFKETYKGMEPGELSKNIYALRNTIFKPKNEIIKEALKP